MTNTDSKISTVLRRLVAIFTALVLGTAGAVAAQSPALATANYCSGQTFAGGDGTAEDPYQVADGGDLQDIGGCLYDDASGPDTGLYGIYFEVTSNIDLNSYDGWWPIGHLEDDWDFDAFRGTFDGGGYAISNMHAYGTWGNLGLFAGLDQQADVHDVVINGDISAWSGYENVGLLAGSAHGAVVNHVTVNGNVDGNQYVGSLFGFTDSGCWNCEVTTNTVIDHVSSAGSVHGYGDADYIGGLVGSARHTTVRYSQSVSAVTVSDTYYCYEPTDVGGLIGYSSESQVTGSVADGRVSSVDSCNSYNFGGLIGYAAETTVSDSQANGDVVGDPGSYNEYFGGAFGNFDTYCDNPLVVNVSATGDVITPSNNGDNVGGLVGRAYDDDCSDMYGSWRNVSATGRVVGDNNVGGLFGLIDDIAVIRNASATGDVVGGGTRVGGLIGFANTWLTLTNASATGDATGSHEVGGLVGDINDGGNVVVDASATGDVMATNWTADCCDSFSVAGGLIGTIEGTRNVLTDVSATGKVTGHGSLVGGLIGYANNETTISGASATGDVTAQGPDGYGVYGVGGLVGHLGTHSTVETSYAHGDVHASAAGGDDWAYDIGGFIGLGEYALSLSQVYASGDVSTDGNDLGGLIGYMNDIDLYASDVYARGDVSTSYDGMAYAGGLIGYIYDTSECCEVFVHNRISQAYATGKVSASDASMDNGYADAFSVGYWTDGRVAWNYNDADFPAPNSFALKDDGINEFGSNSVLTKDSAAMKTRATYPGAWNFGRTGTTAIWGIDPTINDGYPYLAALTEGTVTPPPPVVCDPAALSIKYVKFAKYSSALSRTAKSRLNAAASSIVGSHCTTLNVNGSGKKVSNALAKRRVAKVKAYLLDRINSISDLNVKITVGHAKSAVSNRVNMSLS